MNCAECRDKLVASVEGLLDGPEVKECESHLASCAGCRAEQASIAALQGRLAARGRAAAQVSLAEAVMRRVREAHRVPERSNYMKLFTRWGLGLTAAGAAAIVLFTLLSEPRARATAVSVMCRGAEAAVNLTSIHLRGQLRTLPADNFSYINSDCDFATVELWKEFEPELKWRAEKPGRVALMDGQSTVLYIKPVKIGNKSPSPSPSAYDTDWLHRIGNLSNTISNEVSNAAVLGWKLDLAAETGADGRLKSVVTIHTKSGVPDNDYLKNSFFENADTRRVYRFDDNSEHLEAVQVYLVRPAGEVLIFDLTQIEYNQPIDAALWKLDLPADVSWVKTPEKLPDNDKYTSMTAEQAARAFFEACGRKDWDEVAKYMSPLTEDMKQGLGGLEIVSLGASFTSEKYGGRFVPYEIRFQPQPFLARVSNSNSAHRYVITGVCDTGFAHLLELFWTNGPAVLPNNAVYARLSPAEAVKSYFAAFDQRNWDEMRKFAPDYDVDNDKSQMEALAKQGAEALKMIPTREAGEAFWSPERGCWYVKFLQSSSVKKWNLALRKDNPAGRWQMDGGL